MHLLLDLLHQVKHLLFSAGVGHHLDTHRQTCGLVHCGLGSTRYPISADIIEILFLVLDSGDGQGSSHIVKCVPEVGEGDAIAKFLDIITDTLASPNLKAGT